MFFFVFYKANEAKLYKEQFRLKIDNSNPNQRHHMYEIIAQSCSPGIETHNKRSIFEEQTVINKLQNTIFELNHSTFTTDDNCFIFAPVIIGSDNPVTKGQIFYTFCFLFFFCLENQLLLFKYNVRLCFFFVKFKKKKRELKLQIHLAFHVK